MMNNMMMCSMHDFIKFFEYGTCLGAVGGFALGFYVSRLLYHRRKKNELSAL